VQREVALKLMLVRLDVRKPLCCGFYEDAAVIRSWTVKLILRVCVEYVVMIVVYLFGSVAGIDQYTRNALSKEKHLC
jgi:hypothetical protein